MQTLTLAQIASTARSEEDKNNELARSEWSRQVDANDRVKY